MEDYTFERLDAKHQNAVIAIFNYYIENSLAAYRDKIVENCFFENFVGDIDKYPGYAILNSKKNVVGFCMLEPLMPIDTFKEVAEITYFVHKDNTGMGIGTCALNKLIDDARNIGVKKLVANISSDNIGSIIFHIKHGFEEYGRLRKAGNKFGKYFDIIYMEKMI